jgi:hypothetical protein
MAIDEATSVYLPTGKMNVPPFSATLRSRRNETIAEVSYEDGDSETPASLSLRRDSSALIQLSPKALAEI